MNDEENLRSIPVKPNENKNKGNNNRRASSGDLGDRVLYFSGVKVYFPRKPFKTQRILLSKLILALKEKENALLESPTGTGKVRKNDKRETVNDCCFRLWHCYVEQFLGKFIRTRKRWKLIPRERKPKWLK